MTIEDLKRKLDAVETHAKTQSNDQNNKQDPTFDFSNTLYIEEINNITTEYLNSINLSFKHVKIDDEFYQTYNKEDIISYLSHLHDFDMLVREIYEHKISIKSLNIDDCFHYKKIDLTTIQKVKHINDKLKDVIENKTSHVTIIQGVHHPYDILMKYIAKKGSDAYYDSLYGRETLINCYMDDEEAIPIIIRIENTKIKEMEEDKREKRRKSLLVESVYMMVSLTLSILFIHYIKDRYDRGDFKDNIMLYVPFLSLFFIGFIKRYYDKLFRNHHNKLIAIILEILSSLILFTYIIILTSIAYPGSFPAGCIGIVLIIWTLFMVCGIIQSRAIKGCKIIRRWPLFKETKFFLGPMLFYMTALKDDDVHVAFKFIFRPLIELVLWFYKTMRQALTDVYSLAESWFVERFGFFGYIILILLILIISSAFVTILIVNRKKTREIINEYKLKR